MPMIAFQTVRGSSSGVSNVQELDPPGSALAMLISIETTSARVTLDGSDPSASSAPSNVFPKDAAPILLPVGIGSVVKWVAASAAASVVQVTWLH